jgi:PAS domain S-box-containing protein
MNPADPAQQAQADVLLRTLWASAQPAYVLDAEFKLLDANEAWLALLGLPLDDVVGCDPIGFQPPSDQALNRAQRAQAVAAAKPGQPLPGTHHRLVGARGQESWLDLSLSNLAPVGAPPRWLGLLHDRSAEQRERQAAQRAEQELAQWFELSHGGMVVFDETGLILRFNSAFERLVGAVPEVLGEASAELQALLGWNQGLATALHQGGPLETTSVVATAHNPGGRPLWARLVGLASSIGSTGGPGPSPERRVLAVVNDRSAEAERDLARLERAMLMDAASVGVTTFDAGSLVPTQAARVDPLPTDGLAPVHVDRSGNDTGQSGAMLAVGRALVEPESMVEFDRLQAALRRGERAEVRYAIRHPEMGQRWLSTRVEPRAAADGRNTTSIITVDVTQQENAQRRSDQLLRELTTVLDTSTAGIAYLRGPLLVHCNRRFERMLGFAPGAAAGASLAEIFARGQFSAGDAPDAATTWDELARGLAVEVELSRAAGELGGPLADQTPSAPNWYSLSLRGAQAGGAVSEAVAVLTDITRLKRQQSELEQLLRDRELMFSLSEVGIVFQRGERIERANLAMGVLAGWSASELGSLDVAVLYESARDCVDFEARVAQSLQERGRFSGERRLRRKDGSLRWVQVAVRMVDDADVQAGVICSYMDIEERRRARQGLAQQAERTRSMLNSVLVGIVTVSERGIEWMNRSARRMFAGELADFHGHPISLVATQQADHPLRRTDWLHQLQDEQAQTFECQLRGRDGREFWVVGSAMLSNAGLGVEREVTFALLDIERRRQAELSMALAKGSLQRVIETAPLAIALFDARSLRVQQFNQTAGEFFGKPLLTLTGSPLHEICEPDQAQALGDWLRSVAQGGGPCEHEWQVMPPANAEAPGLPQRVWDCRIASLDEDADGITQLLLVASDVTQQREAERARLQAAIDQREVLIREVHHRIKNNLQGVAGLLQQSAAQKPELAGALNEAVSQVQAIAQVHGLHVGGAASLALAELLRAIAQSVQRTFGSPVAVDFEGHVPHLLPEAESIPVALTVNELLTNAIKHGRGEPVRCTLVALGDSVCIRVTGPGQLPPGFDLKRVPAGVSGLGLVRALLPRRSAVLTLAQSGSDVVAEVRLNAPSVRWPHSEQRHEVDQRQLDL